MFNDYPENLPSSLFNKINSEYIKKQKATILNNDKSDMVSNQEENGENKTPTLSSLELDMLGTIFYLSKRNEEIIKKLAKKNLFYKTNSTINQYLLDNENLQNYLISLGVTTPSTEYNLPSIATTNTLLDNTFNLINSLIYSQTAISTLNLLPYIKPQIELVETIYNNNKRKC